MTEPVREPADATRLDAVLAATDFSETAGVAADWAAEIARATGARLHLLHVLTLPDPVHDYLPSPPDLREALQRAAVDRLDEEAARLDTGGLAITTELRIGIPSQTIIETVAELDPGLVVVGTRGLTGLQHLLLGSTAQRVVQRCPKPVLTVHPEDRGRHRPIRTLLVPTDFSHDAERAVEAARRLLRGLEGARLVLLHAYHLPIEYTAYGPIPTSIHYLEDTAAEAQELLDRVAGELRREGLTVETVAREGYAPEAIVAEAEARNVDLIAMGTHGRSGLTHLLLGSTAERVVQRAPCPVMTVRRGEEGR